MNFSTRVPFLILAAAVIAADQMTKQLVASELRVGEVRPIVDGAFNLTHTLNRGAAFSLMSDTSSSVQLGILIVVSLLASAGILALLWRSRQESWVARTGLAMVLGGALGNLWDRIRNGGVIDFLDFHFRTYHWPVFNLADAAIVVGALLVLCEIFFGEGISRRSLRPSRPAGSPPAEP
jgi:signal peptidase II